MPQDSYKVLKNDMCGIHNALEYAVACLKAGSLDETAKSQLETALWQARRYTDGDPDSLDSAADMTEESNNPGANLAFSVDNVPIRVGNDMRVNLDDGERTISVVLTHEGIIMDVWPAGANEPSATCSMMYDEAVEELCH